MTDLDPELGSLLMEGDGLPWHIPDEWPAMILDSSQRNPHPPEGSCDRD